MTTLIAYSTYTHSELCAENKRVSSIGMKGEKLDLHMRMLQNARSFNGKKEDQTDTVVFFIDNTSNKPVFCTYINLEKPVKDQVARCWKEFRKERPKLAKLMDKGKCIISLSHDY